ncbi:S8 family peptidase [Pseudohaliea rubra]|uniref:Alkaline serine protease n=1 Tax=Pseudohaliea rubra DSM 19751 TaxID=1265313 RepID=A0A095VTS0_9GAMM|nr:S8 family peptidase [Pseudohaliea rubra]KGE04765.1 alkaline serine protease [Pseudohaliea rubra DSM 19751]
MGGNINGLLRSLGAPTLCFLAAVAHGQPASVMLQGEAAETLREQVLAVGGELTHFLPIIDAIGARLTPAQVDQLRGAAGVHRIIDDLDRKEPEAPPPACQLGAGLELDIDGHVVRWRLFNKGKDSAGLETVTLAWPETLGELDRASFAGRALTATLDGSRQGATLLAADALPLAGGAAATLQLEFSRPWPSGELHQRHLNLTATFADECAVELIPGYDDNDGDSYYSTVAGADLLHRHGITGAGVTVAVLDSGLWDDPRLTRDTQGEPRVLASYDAIAGEEVSIAFDESGHGSHMTSILAQSRPVTRAEATPGAWRGIAPDARLVVVKAFSREGQGDLLDIVRGVQWIVDHRETYGIRVINLSFAAKPRWPYWQDPINQALMRAWDAGIVAVAAAGNEGPDAMTVGSPGNLPYLLTVGAITDSWTVHDPDDDYLPDFSSRGPTPSAHIKPDLVAPGGHMAGLTRPGSTLTQEFPEYQLANGDFVMTGTSQAAALVSGLVALLLEVEPELTPDDVKCKFMSSANPAISADGRLSYSPFEQGAGAISIQRALTLGDTGCGNAGLNLKTDIAGEDHFEGPAVLAEDGSPTLPGLEQMVTPEPPEKGHSESRRWGIKAHIERPQHGMSEPGTPEDPQLPFDWHSLYLEEKARMEQLSRTPE